MVGENGDGGVAFCLSDDDEVVVVNNCNRLVVEGDDDPWDDEAW